jgi:hypothetical protein
LIKIAAIIKAFAGFQDDLRQTVQQSMVQLQHNLEPMARQFAAGMLNTNGTPMKRKHP